jgi:ketosteroid isomerase-like protein
VKEEGMTDPLALAQRYYESLERNDAAGVSSLLSDDAVVDVPGATLTGGAQFQGWMQAFFDAFPDIGHTHTPLEVSGDSVKTELRVAGTHTAPLVSPDGTIEPTGKPIVINAKNTMRVADDRIVALKIEFDQGDFMRQLGMG